MSIRTFILRRKRGYVEGQSAYCGILMAGTCIEIQTVDYTNVLAAIKSLNEQITLRGFDCPQQTFEEIEFRDDIPSAHLPPQTEPEQPPRRCGRSKKQAV